MKLSILALFLGSTLARHHHGNKHHGHSHHADEFENDFDIRPDTPQYDEDAEADAGAGFGHPSGGDDPNSVHSETSY